MESVQRQTDLTNPGAIAFLSNDHPGLMGKLSASGWFEVRDLVFRWILLIHVNINITSLKGNGRRWKEYRDVSR
jgi:hypothetical protein